jgi:hypothetical protein
MNDHATRERQQNDESTISLCPIAPCARRRLLIGRRGVPPASVRELVDTTQTMA